MIQLCSFHHKCVCMLRSEDYGGEAENYCAAFPLRIFCTNRVLLQTMLYHTSIHFKIEHMLLRPKLKPLIESIQNGVLLAE